MVRSTVSITDVDASKQLLTSIYKTCADLEGLNIWERLSALHTLGVHVKGAETPFCTIVAVRYRLFGGINDILCDRRDALAACVILLRGRAG